MLGGAWTMNLVWQLSGGRGASASSCRDDPGISPKMLTARLRELEDKGVVDRTVAPTSPPSVEYSLSDMGTSSCP
jgi:DNA-binding HxlR family transcriptional regulator